jgi:(S)-2-hydroxyglutarate dehydrogenase
LAGVTDVLIVGGGIVGLATAYQLLSSRPDLRVAIREQERGVGLQQSSRNSGVLHAGLYYPPGSAKAVWCRAGKEEMERFCADHGVPLVRTGKVVVAVDHSELPGLAALRDRARTNGVPVEELDARGLREHEPHVAGVAGLWSPETATTDFGAVCRALATEVVARGADLRTGVEVLGIRERSDRVRVRTTDGDVEARAVVTCSGLQADRVVAWTERQDDTRVVPFRGSWLQLRPERSHLVKGNIYPVPTGGGLPFLGVHLTRRIDGRVWAGPNAVLAGARSGPRPWSVDARDAWDTIRYPGTWHLARRHTKVAIHEVWHDMILRAAARELQRYVPALQPVDLERGPWGVRAQVVTRTGDLVEDFELRGANRVIHVLNAPSPAATASLAIGREVSRRTIDAL